MTRILFQGDSITDAGRDRNNDINPGTGYPAFVKGRLGVDYPGVYDVINRAVSGDRVVDVYARIKRDIINLKPDVLSILIGINDVWHEIGGHNGVDADKYFMVYDLLLKEVKAALPDIKFVILEPFVLEASATCATEEIPDRWEYFHSECLKRAEMAKKVAEKYGAVFVPLQDAFDEAARLAPADWWLRDGVHPTSVGHELITRRWVKALGL